MRGAWPFDVAIRPWLKRGAAVLIAVSVIGLSLSAYLSIIGYTIWESGRYGRLNTFLYAIDGALTFPAHWAAGLRGGGAGGGLDGIAPRVYSILASAYVWGILTSALAFFKPKSRLAYWLVAAAAAGLAAASARAGWASLTPVP